MEASCKNLIVGEHLTEEKTRREKNIMFGRGKIIWII